MAATSQDSDLISQITVESAASGRWERREGYGTLLTYKPVQYPGPRSFGSVSVPSSVASTLSTIGTMKPTAIRPPAGIVTGVSNTIVNVPSGSLGAIAGAVADLSTLFRSGITDRLLRSND